ncbi:hypothetical protein WJX72_011434 [[Myrmecia] bisecta]|uniref:TauD/TfdA-like domain-containing protein n=1 Tax=[Myrmecia] bisecta TaxID=41462 RepID=A0AAW1PH63_9CHLO
MCLLKLTWRTSTCEELRASCHHTSTSSWSSCRFDPNQSASVTTRRDTMAVTKADFTLPTLGAKLDHIHQETINGIGFKVVRGLPVDRYSIEDAALAFWGLGTYFGAAMSQNKVGHLLGHVRDIGNDPAHPLSRPYTTRLPQPYHNDNSDIVALLCLKTAKSGGASSWCSSHTVHNEVLRRRPDLYKVLTEPIYQDRKDEIPAGKKPYYAMSVFHHYQGYLTVAGASFVEVVHRHEGVPPLSSIQREALDFLQEVAAEEGVRIDSVLQPGDISICNNVSVWHSRTAFEDHKEQDRKRHMLRLWLASPIGWPLPDIYEERWGSTEVGNRGFINCPGFTPNVSLDPFEAHLQRIAATAKAA